METWFWILLLAGILLAVGIFLHSISQRIRYFLNTLLHLSAQESLEERPPRSLSGLEPTLFPLIRRDFPDFDPVQAKNRVRDHLKQSFRKKRSLEIHNVVIHNYLHESVEKNIVYQAAVSWKEGGTRQQKRFDVYETYRLPQHEGTVAANCPNCGATLGFGAVECAYCGSRIANPLGQNWEFTRITES